MREMAEYMLNGDDCQGCGEHLGDGPGYPRFCAACGGEPAGAIYSSHRERRRAKRRRRQRRKADEMAAMMAGGVADAMRAEGWVQHTAYHWQVREPFGVVDFWPSSRKFMLGGVVQEGEVSEVRAAVARWREQGRGVA